MKQRFASQLPNAYFLDVDNAAGLQQHLRQIGFLNNDEHVTDLAKAGQGNMNLTLRVTTNQRTFIAKQSRPWVEKFPQIDAPSERALIEGGFYQLVGNEPKLASYMPKLWLIDKPSHILLLENLGRAADYCFIYQKQQQLTLDETRQQAIFLGLLHASFNKNTTDAYIFNRGMRQLNHEHIFVFPFNPNNGFDLNNVTPGLQEVANLVHEDESLKQKVRHLGDAYLSDGDYLLHGDYFPGSWLNTPDGLKVIDHEFCFFGPAEFDMGVFTAHLMMANQPTAVLEVAWQQYNKHVGFDVPLALNFAGVEIIRRLVGLAQLPLELDLNKKTALLAEARNLVLYPEQTELWQIIAQQTITQ